MEKVRTQKLYVMIEVMVDECREGVTRCSTVIGNGRNRRKAHAWRCADYDAGAGLDAAPTGEGIGVVHDSTTSDRRVSHLRRLLAV